MKIQGNQGSPGIPELAGSQRVERAQIEQDSPIGKEDSVRISSRAKEVASIKARVDAVPDVRTDRVEELRAGIEAGTYNIRGEMVAEKMIRETLIDTIL